MGSEFWGGFKEWIKMIMLEKEGNISFKDIDLILIVDDLDEIM